MLPEAEDQSSEQRIRQLEQQLAVLQQSNSFISIFGTIAGNLTVSSSNRVQY